MRSIVIGLTVFFFTFSAVIFYKALQFSTRASTINVPITDLPVINEPPVNIPPSSKDNAPHQTQEANKTVDHIIQPQATDKSASVIPDITTAQPAEDTATTTIEKPVDITPQATRVTYHPRTLTIFDGKAFRSGQDIVREAATPKIEKLISEISVFPNSNILIEGHTDGIPTGHQRRNNMNLSVRRANAIGKILISRGIAPERITVVGYGDTRPIDTNRTEEGRAKNRRVEVKLMLKEGEN